MSPIPCWLPRLAVQSGVFPLFEVEGGLTYTMSEPEKTLPIDSYLAKQKRYRHLDDTQIAGLQADVDTDWQRLMRKVSTAGS